ncbi:MAG: hypothetical protein SCALA702_02270 [Melioribacteraceae bacterium]|nr:MAG: hypothetical protein SCALA702_02270 [Melioribacteraceae bacterium]
MQKHFFILLSVVLAFLLISCNEGGTEPQEVIPGCRDYLWSIDTLAEPSTGLSITSLLAVDTNKIFIGGFSYDSNQLLYMHDGEDFQNIVQDQISNLYTIMEYNSNIFMSDGSSSIYQLTDQNRIKEIYHDSQNQVTFYHYQTYKEKLYVAGTKARLGGFVIKSFDGLNWSSEFDSNVKDEFMFSFGVSNSTFFLLTVKDDDFTLYSLRNNVLNSIGQFGYSNIFTIDDNLYIREETGRFFKIINGEVQTWFNLPAGEIYGATRARSESDIFIYQVNGIGHYNGIDYKRIVEFDQPHSISGMDITQNGAFFIVRPISQNYLLLYRGILST